MRSGQTGRDNRLVLPGNEQNNAVSTGETVNENGLTALTERERINLSSGKRNKIVSTFRDAVSFVRNALSDRQNIDRAYLGKIPDFVSRKILEDTGLDVKGFGVMMNGNDVRHIMKNHGDAATEQSRGQIAITPDDIARIPEILSSPDLIDAPKVPDGKGRTTVIFEKQIGDYYITIQGISDGKRLLQTDTLYKRRTRTTRDTMPGAQESPVPVINAQGEQPQSSSINSILPGGQDVNIQAVSPDSSVGAAADGVLQGGLVLPGVDSEDMAGYDVDTSNNLTGGADNGRRAEALTARERTSGADVRGGDRRSHTRRAGTHTRAYGGSKEPADWAVGHLIKSPTSPAGRALSSARQYAPDVFFVDDAAIKSRNQSAWALTNDGKIYISDSVPEELADVVGYHEAVHALKQRGNQQYDDLVNRIGEQLNYGENADQVLGIILKSRLKGKSVLDLTLDELNTAYDELNAVVWGYHKADPENARAQFAGVFQDYDAYIWELDNIMEGVAAVSPDSSVGAAQTGLGSESLPETAVGAEKISPWVQFQASSDEFIPEGANAAREVEVPVRDPQGRRIRRTASTAMGAKAIPDEVVGDIQNMVLRGELSYDRVSDKSSINWALKTIQDKGYQGALEEFRSSVNKGVISKDIATLGQQLLINAANAGDSRTTAELLSLYAQMETTAGQAVQAASILRKLDPSAQLYAAQRAVHDLEKAIQDKYKDIEITIDQSLIDEFNSQTTQEGRDTVMDRIYQNVADQVPSTWRDKWNAWRYLSMLANPRTHVRKFVGNIGFQPLRFAKDRVASVIEAGVSRAGGDIERTKSFASAPELYRAAWNDWTNVKDVLSGNKYDDVRSEINSRRRIFKTAPLEAARTGNSWLLEFEDSIFKRITYADALAGYLQANGVTAEQYQNGTADPELLERARSHAVREAQEATFRDKNAFSDAISSIGFRRPKNNIERAINMAVHGVLPFRRTPANVAVRAVEYSPLGLIGTAAKGIMRFIFLNL